MALQLCDPALVALQKSVLERYQLPTALPSQMSVRQHMEVMQRDKKVDAGQIRWALPTAIGHAVMTRDVPLAVVEQVLINS
jgi:3-dehydroquinate synthase